MVEEQGCGRLREDGRHRTPAPEGGGGGPGDEQQGPFWDLGAGGTVAGPCPGDEPSRPLRPGLGQAEEKRPRLLGVHCGEKPGLRGARAARRSWSQGLRVLHFQHRGGPGRATGQPGEGGRATELTGGPSMARKGPDASASSAFMGQSKNRLLCDLGHVSKPLWASASLAAQGE